MNIFNKFLIIMLSFAFAQQSFGMQTFKQVALPRLSPKMLGIAAITAGATAAAYYGISHRHSIWDFAKRITGLNSTPASLNTLPLDQAPSGDNCKHEESSTQEFEAKGINQIKVNGKDIAYTISYTTTPENLIKVTCTKKTVTKNYFTCLTNTVTHYPEQKTLVISLSHSLGYLQLERIAKYEVKIELPQGYKNTKQNTFTTRSEEFNINK